MCFKVLGELTKMLQLSEPVIQYLLRVDFIILKSKLLAKEGMGKFQFFYITIFINTVDFFVVIISTAECD